LVIIIAMTIFFKFCVSVENFWYLLILTARQIRKATNPFVIGTAAMAVASSSIGLISATADAAVTREYSSK
jgi:hypothetical protein